MLSNSVRAVFVGVLFTKGVVEFCSLAVKPCSPEDWSATASSKGGQHRNAAPVIELFAATECSARPTIALTLIRLSTNEYCAQAVRTLKGSCTILLNRASSCRPSL